MTTAAQEYIRQVQKRLRRPLTTHEQGVALNARDKGVLPSTMAVLLRHLGDVR